MSDRTKQVPGKHYREHCLHEHLDIYLLPRKFRTRFHRHQGIQSLGKLKRHHLAAPFTYIRANWSSRFNTCSIRRNSLVEHRRPITVDWTVASEDTICWSSSAKEDSSESSGWCSIFVKIIVDRLLRCWRTSMMLIRRDDRGIGLMQPQNLVLKVDEPSLLYTCQVFPGKLHLCI
jgi:hypothetical protein